MGEEKIKIALIEPVGGHGGMDFYDYGLAMGLGENGVEVHYFTSTQTNTRQYKNVITYLIFRKVWDTQNKIIRLYFFLNGYFKSFKTAKKKKIKVIHFQFFDLGWLNLLVMLLASFFRFKKILTLHDISSFKSNDSSFLEKTILKRFSKIIVHNRLSYDELSKKVIANQDVYIIPHGNYLPFIEELEYAPEEKQKLRLLFFGQIKKVKGLDILLEAMSIIVQDNVNIELVIAGKPWHDELSHYENQIKDLKLEGFVKTHFQYIPNDKVSSFFSNCDIVILPYKKIYQSGVLLLSMSYGRVTLTSDLPAFKEIVEDGKTGYLFESENPEDLARVLIEITENMGQLKELNENASKMLKSDFDWIKIGKQTRKLYTYL